MKQPIIMIDGNEATASVAHRLSEVIAIYPITPSSGMGEFSDEWSAKGKKNLWGTTPLVIEMQSEGGAAGTVHGALQTGALTTTFTASQGLLLMIPNMYKIAGELTSTVFHVAARAIASHALSIYGDHQDVMAVRQTGWALLSSGSVQEAQDFAAIAQAATLKARVPFMHFFDGFRTSHEVTKIFQLTDEELRQMLDDDLVRAHRARGLTPEHPTLRGTAQNPDVYFQMREASNNYYTATPAIVQEMMDKFAKVTGRHYNLFDYSGHPEAERVIIIMGSGGEVVEETVSYLAAKGEKVGVLRVRLYRPFSIEHFIKGLPKTVKSIAVLDRTKEPGANGEPMYLDIVNALMEGKRADINVIGGRYGLSSKEFTPAMTKAVLDELAKPEPKNHFTLGINDDVSNTSLTVDSSFSLESEGMVSCVFFGLGSDGTVGANKNSIKIIGEETENYAQGYFYYDSKKSGTVTMSHLRFGPKAIRAPYLIEANQANFVACHQYAFLERVDMLKYAKEGGIFLLNSMFGPDEIWDELPQEVQKDIITKKLKFHVINGYDVAEQTGMGGRMNTIMQTAFFAISGILPREAAIAEIKHAIEKSYGKRGEAVVKKNFEAVDATVANLHEVKVPAAVTSKTTRRLPVPNEAPDFVKNVLGQIIDSDGDNIPVSAFPIDGTFPTGTTQWEKRNLALEIPVWDADICIQCGKCVMVCPHAVIRHKVYDEKLVAGAPDTFKHTPSKFKEFSTGFAYTLQVAPEDCTGCTLCVEVCPVKDKRAVGRKAINMEPQPALREAEAKNWDFFMNIPDMDRKLFNPSTIKNSQLLRPLFEFSGACAGCGETPYVKLVSQLFGDRAVIANATGCSSIYGGNLPTTPWAKNADGRGPAWSNSLFEDNAEFGLGMRLTIDKQAEYALELLKSFESTVSTELVEAILNANQEDETGIGAQRERVVELKNKLSKSSDSRAKDLISLADNLVKKSVWIIGGDGWAYDIGYGGLDHVLASGRNVNILVLDTEVYSNTGGQASKSTPRAAVAKFAMSGKGLPKKDLGLIAMSYGYVYVARVAMGANDQQTLKALIEAEAYDGPSLVIAYSPCIAHGYDMAKSLDQTKLAVQSGHWPMYRYNPALAEQGQNPLVIESKEPSIPISQYAYNETRYKMLTQMDEERAEMLMKEAQHDAKSRWTLYQQMASMHYDENNGTEEKKS
ncbi:MAG: pyruvate:ferredoxin (flavodoxin) oxidoreductase [Anaerolineales bacterium]|uniref:pyruvate:ferredoxin (flavodoxin) oxidoreductase n=1 Tax=Candidatus Villigracilis affinis TaxID=3140682 RepID=UPI001B6B7FD1|nr:pyruvate:ferredoxin (flavodoxin) oxidoreductase [Anaerolineales bacterium]MBK9602991.1 pyruvate:ferredoxin (flavodoxin) oxidoreductase [Anaerolineales bacterium]MBL0346168.1 pyruvate:ferredoxin (flavodoxin) oxidoreductase [Anaerolineales bacterium]MBP8047903.1 pyruvate:ferredoxin (flavodoxin) oxidoreductase [Anaerolineales bacterium]